MTINPPHQRLYVRFVTISVTRGMVGGAILGLGSTLLFLFAPSPYGVAENLPQVEVFLCGPVIFTLSLFVGGFVGLILGLICGVVIGPFAAVTTPTPTNQIVLRLLAALAGCITPFIVILLLTWIFFGAFAVVYIIALSWVYVIAILLTALVVSQIVVTTFLRELSELHPTFS